MTPLTKAHFQTLAYDVVLVDADLAPLTPAQCAARGIRHSSTDDHSTAVRSDDPDWLLQGALRAAGRKYRP